NVAWSLQIEQRIRILHPLPVRDHHPPAPPRDRPRPRPVVVEAVMHDSRPPRIRQELGAVPQQAPGGHFEPHPHGPHSGVLHVEQRRPAGAELFHHHPQIHLGAVDHQLLIGLKLLPVWPFTRADARPAHLELVPPPPHRFHHPPQLPPPAP